jgi:hypothetical protein
MRSNTYLLALGSVLFSIAYVGGFCSLSKHCKSSSRRSIVRTLQQKTIYHVSERFQDDDLATLEWRDAITRRKVLASMALSSLVPYMCYADEPSNIIKSQADAEDPIAVFGKSLQNMNFDNNESDSSSSKPSPSFDDVSFPYSTPNSDNGSAGGGDLNRAIQQIKMEQKRRVDPMTHG